MLELLQNHDNIIIIQDITPAAGYESTTNLRLRRRNIKYFKYAYTYYYDRSTSVLPAGTVVRSTSRATIVPVCHTNSTKSTRVLF